MHALVLITSLCCGRAMAQTIDLGPLPLNLDNVPGAAATPTPGTAAAEATPPPLPTQKAAVLDGPVAQLYLYVEPYETRVEALFDVTSVEEWLGRDGGEKTAPVTIAQQSEIIQQAEKLAADWCSVSTVEGHQPYTAPTAYFVKGKPGATVPMDKDEDLARNQCMLGLVWEFSTNVVPDTLDVRWKGWINELRSMPVLILFGNQSDRTEVNSITKKIFWENKGRLRPSPLASVPTFEPAKPVSIPVGAILWILGGIAFYAYIWHRDYRLPGGGLPYFGVWLFGLVLVGKLVTVTLPGSQSAPTIQDASAAQGIVSPLLRNVYRAFDQRSESRIYDVLNLSVDGELLRKLYLETIQALTLDGREGTRVLITEFEASVDEVTGQTPTGGFIADCNWSTIGTVGHWGHSHPRYNGYKAKLTVEPLKGEWKLTALDVQEVRRK